MVLILTLFLMFYSQHCIWVTSEAYSSPSIVLSARDNQGGRIIFDDYREAYYWLRQNTPPVRFLFSQLFISDDFDLILIGCQSDVLVGLWISDHSYG